MSAASGQVEGAEQGVVGPCWRPDSWRDKSSAHQPAYDDAHALAAALAALSVLPPLVTSGEVDHLRDLFADAQSGRRFILQGGECAETFADCVPSVITNRLKVLLQMSLILEHGLGKPVVRVGRFAGQYAKPRTVETETIGGVTLPVYRGDLVNGAEFTARARRPDPRRLLDGHAHSAMTLNFVRGLVDGGFADLHHPEYWNLDWVSHSPLASEYRRRVDAIGESVRFVEARAGRQLEAFNRVDFFTSHEALVLHAEAAQTRTVPRKSGWYNLSTHFPWIGMRTTALDGGHMEYCRGLRNPVGMKIGPSATPAWLREACGILNPANEAGKLVLITRLGTHAIDRLLPALIDAVKDRSVLWIVDPMHGNTEVTPEGYKTRPFEAIVSEVEQAFAIHVRAGSVLGGVHLELTGEDVTECTGGARQLSGTDLARAYHSTVDPRLNYEQAVELALRIVSLAARTVRPTAG